MSEASQGEGESEATSRRRNVSEASQGEGESEATSRSRDVSEASQGEGESEATSRSRNVSEASQGEGESEATSRSRDVSEASQGEGESEATSRSRNVSEASRGEASEASRNAARIEVQGGATIALAGDATIGRDAGCDVVLDASWVAARHARLELVEASHKLVADGGPVIVGGVAVREAMLQDGDVLRLPDPTTASFVTLVYGNPAAPRPPAVVHFATPPGQPLLTIGRSAAGDTDIVLDQPLVSRRHAELAWQDGAHVLRDVGSHHGTFVNGERLVAPRVLASGDVIQIGTFRLTYDGDSLDSFDQRGAIRLDATAVRRVVDGRTLLAETTLSIEPCELVAIVGQSGAGKSTLMMALCGFHPATSGRVAINGDDLYAGIDAYRSIVGYVPQDDTLHRALPVARALRYAAQLRLPVDTSPAEIDARIERVLDAVDMTSFRGQRIDRLSGGQRKRVSIACELLADPPLIFLDEPTSGLDPGLERKLMYTLRKLADGGRTIVLVTHATANIRQCDHIAFMAAGKMVYFGPPAQAPAFFGVADFADIYASCDRVAHPDAAETWQAKFAASLQYQKYVVERPARAPAAPSIEQSSEKEARARRYHTSAWHQLRVTTRRYLDLMLADRRNLALLLLQAPVIGVLLLLVSGASALTGGRVDALKLLFMLATTGVWFGVINSAREICKETPILDRERLAGLRAGPYLASKIAVLLALVIVQSVLLVGTVALRVRLPGAGILLPAPLELVITVVLAGLAGLSLGLCLSAFAANPDKATSLIPIVLVPQVLFAGVMFTLHGVTASVSWLTSSRAAMEALASTVDVNELPQALLATDPAYAHTAANLATAWAALGGQALVFALIAWAALHRRA